MRFYVTTAQLWVAQQVAALGFVHGVYLPRAPVVRTGRDYGQLVADCVQLPLAWIGVQGEAFDACSLVDEARSFMLGGRASLAFLMPMTLESVRAVKGCRREGTLPGLQFIASPVQALVAAQAGAAAIVLDAHLLGTAGIALAPLVVEIRGLFEKACLHTEILVEGARDVAEVGRVAVAGADGVICEWDVLETLAYHPLSDQGIERLLAERAPQ